MIVALALRNLARNKRRNLLTALGVAVAIFVVASLQAAIDGILFPVEQASADRLLSVRERRRPNVLASRLPEALEVTLARIPGVAAATGVSLDLALVGDQRVHVFVHGVDPAVFRRVKRLRLADAAWERFASERRAAIVGHLLAAQRGWTEGSLVELPSMGLSFRVGAVLPPQGERTRELGLLRTLGYTPGEVLALVATESIAISLSGGALGLLTAWLAVGGSSAALAGLRLGPTLVVVALLASILIGLLGALAAALPAVRMPIVSALRAVD
ncbi:ABC transporter permease [Sorangium sp. So ce269]